MGDTLIKLRIAIVLVITAVLSYCAMKIMGLPPVGVDDANILFVYSKHFAMGEGLVYNIGGERVEGFTSMLWMLLTAAGYLFTDFPYPLFLMLNLLLVGGALGYATHFVEAQFGASRAHAWLPLSLPGLLFLAWVMANPMYLIWTVASLMETGLWACLLLATAVFVLKVIGYGDIDRRAVYIFSLLNALLILTRPEGVAWVLTFSALLLLLLRSQGASAAKVWRIMGTIVGISALTLCVLVAFRVAYFGYPLPNTYYVKVTPDKLYNLKWGLAYFFDFVKASPLIVAIVGVSALGFLRHLPAALRTLFAGAAMPARHLIEFALAGVVLVSALLPILMGGDIFGGFRFYQPLWPLYICVLFYLPFTAGWWKTQNLAIVASVSALTLVALTYSNSVRWPSLSEDRARVAHLFELSERLSLTGDYLHRLFDNYANGLPSVGASAAGGSKIGYDGRVVDMMGLNFTPMAHHDGDKKGIRGHAAFSKPVFWANAPDLLEPNLCRRQGPPVNVARNPDNWLHRIYRGLPADQDFVASYIFVALDVPDTDDRVCTYMSKEWFTALQADQRYQIEVVD